MSSPDKQKVEDANIDITQFESCDEAVLCSTKAETNTDEHLEDHETETSHCPPDIIKIDENVAFESQLSTKNICTIEFKVIWNKQVFEVIFDEKKKIEDLKEHIKELTGIPVKMQKLMYKGLIKDDQATLQQSNICKGAKLMVVGSTLKDVMTVAQPTKEKQKESSSSTGGTSKPEPLCSQKEHKKILDKGIPDDAMPGIFGIKEKLPLHPLSGMYNKRGGKVRLTFKLEVDQLWLGTKERTEKIPMSSIRSVISEPISDHKEYHIMGIQLGPTEASRYWVYWVPAQYIEAIKDTVLGRWQSF